MLYDGVQGLEEVYCFYCMLVKIGGSPGLPAGLPALWKPHTLSGGILMYCTQACCTGGSF